MSDTSQSVAETVITHDDIVVRRELSRTRGGFVGTLRIESTSETPATVHVVDEFPATLPIDMVGFRPGAEPESGEITPQRATVTHPVADDPVEIEYGLTLREEVRDIEFDAPTIRAVVTPDGEGAPHSYTDGGERMSADVEAPSESDGPARSRSSMRPRLGGGRAEPDDSAAPSPQEPTGTETEPTGVEASSDASERVVEQVETTADSLTADVDELRTHVYDEIARLDTALANQRATCDGVRTDLDTLDDRVTGVEEELQGVRGVVLEVLAEFATISDDIEAMRGDLEQLRTEVGDLAEAHESLADVVDPPTGDEITRCD